MKNLRIFAAALLLIALCLSMFSCKGEDKTAVVAFPKNSADGYNWDVPEFDGEYFSLTSQRTYSEQAPGLPSTTYHEWTFTPVKSGVSTIVFVQYDSKEDFEAKTDPFRKVIITYEISDTLGVTETDRTDLNYKQD